MSARKPRAAESIKRGIRSPTLVTYPTNLQSKDTVDSNGFGDAKITILSTVDHKTVISAGKHDQPSLNKQPAISLQSGIKLKKTFCLTIKHDPVVARYRKITRNTGV